MPSPTVNKEQAKKQSKALKEFHSNPDKPTSAGSIKEPRAINNVRRKISDLTDPSAEIIRKALLGGVVPEMEVWKGTNEEKDNILAKDKSAKFLIVEIEEGLEVEVLITYVPVSKTKIELAKWLLIQDASLKKAAEDSKLRKLEAALKQKLAEDRGAVPKTDLAEEARKAAAKGEHIRPAELVDFEYDESWDDDQDSEEDT